jgi:hypothetical protein
MKKKLDFDERIEQILDGVFKDDGTDYSSRMRTKYYKSKKFKLKIMFNEKTNYILLSFKKEVFKNSTKWPSYQTYLEKEFLFTETEDFLNELNKEVKKIQLKDIF